jgi:hypothetical protein
VCFECDSCFTGNVGGGSFESETAWNIKDAEGGTIAEGSGLWGSNSDSFCTGTCIVCEPGEQPDAVNNGCALCEPGKSSSSSSAAPCTECVPGTHASEAGATSCQLCEEGKATSSAPGATMCYDYGACLQVQVVGCQEAYWSDVINGFFDLYEGSECGDTGGRNSYFNSAGNVFLAYSLEFSSWDIGAACGGDPVRAYAEGSQFYSFVGTSSEWECSTGLGSFWTRPMAITCSMFEGQVKECISGT